MASAYGWAGVTLGVLLILGPLVASLRGMLKRGEDRQAYLDEIERLKRERAEVEAKLRAAIAALEVVRATSRDSASGLPSDLGVQSRQKPVRGGGPESGGVGGGRRPPLPAAPTRNDHLLDASRGDHRRYQCRLY